MSASDAIDAVAREALRQRALVAAILAASEDDVAVDGALDATSVEHGLAAYRGNLGATAERALAAAFPTVQRAVGETAFAALAREHAREVPPTLGDLGEWGASLPAWLET